MHRKLNTWAWYKIKNKNKVIFITSGNKPFENVSKLSICEQHYQIKMRSVIKLREQ
jgi:hypothetical protein